LPNYYHLFSFSLLSTCLFSARAVTSCHFGNFNRFCYLLTYLLTYLLYRAVGGLLWSSGFFCCRHEGM